MYRRFNRLVCATVLAFAATACASSNAGPERVYLRSSLNLPSTGRVIDAERIARSGSETAIDAIRAFVPNARLTGSAWGPLEASSSPQAQLRVVLDGHPVGDVESLRTIPARDLAAIHVLSAADAMSHFGANYSGGAIVLETYGVLRRQ